MMKLPFLLLIILLWACNNSPTIPPIPNVKIVVTSPSANAIYPIDRIINISWSEVGTIGPVDIALRPAGTDLPQWLLFERVTGGKVIWRNWWERHSSIQTGHYVIMIGTPNRPPYVNATSAVFFLERS